MAWIVRDREMLASAEVAATRAARRRGLLGRDGIDGAMVLCPARQVHTLGMRFALDIAWCAADGRVLRVASLAPGRLSRRVHAARFVIELEAGTAARWALRPGDVVEVVDD